MFRLSGMSINYDGLHECLFCPSYLQTTDNLQFLALGILELEQLRARTNKIRTLSPAIQPFACGYSSSLTK